MEAKAPLRSAEDATCYAWGPVTRPRKFLKILVLGDAMQSCEIA